MNKKIKVLLLVTFLALTTSCQKKECELNNQNIKLKIVSETQTIDLTLPSRSYVHINMDKNQLFINSQIDTEIQQSMSNYSQEKEGTFVDSRDNRTYKKVRIGHQTWMAENLKATKLSNNQAINNVRNSKDWIETQEPAMVWYNNNMKEHNSIYGPLYNWYAVETELLCPKGWKVPTEQDWETLIEYLGGKNIAGGKLKNSDGKHWNQPNTNSTNETMFNAIPGGRRHPSDANFGLIGEAGGWWTSTEININRAWHYYMTFNNGGIMKTPYSKKGGFSVRCIKEQSFSLKIEE